MGHWYTSQKMKDYLQRCKTNSKLSLGHKWFFQIKNVPKYKAKLVKKNHEGNKFNVFRLARTKP